MDIEVIGPPINQDWCHLTLFIANPETNILGIFADIHLRDTATLSLKLHQTDGV